MQTKEKLANKKMMAKKFTRSSTSLHRIKNFWSARLAGNREKGNFSLGFFFLLLVVWLPMGFHFASTNAHYMLTKCHKIDYNQIFFRIEFRSDLHLLHISLGCTNIFHHLFHSVHLMSTRTNEWMMSDIEFDGYTNTQTRVILMHRGTPRYGIHKTRHTNRQ